MTWSRLREKHKKPIKWHYHKIMCEVSYWFYWRFNYSCSDYYYHMDKLCKTGFNLYGMRIK